MGDTPCLFDYATSELSQDAFFAWLLAWADKKYDGPEHDLAVAFLETVFRNDERHLSLPSDISIEVWRQYYHMDVFCTINDSEYAIILEDKVNTQQHDGQLERYLESVIGEKKFKHVVCIYCKTGDQSDWSGVKKSGYVVMNRTELIKVIDGPEGRAACSANLIIADFARHLKGIDELVQGYRNKPLKDWDWNAWAGFYMELQKDRPDGRWDYVPNPSGGFMGFWWHWESVPGGHVYLQLEEGKACFKVEVGDGADAQALKFDWNERFMMTAKNVPDLIIKVVRPKVLRIGTWMTVAVLEDDCRVVDSKGLLDIDATVAKLREMERVLDTAVADLSGGGQ